MTSDLVAWLRLQLDEDAAWALAASQTDPPGTPTGEHWQWVCERCDAALTPDPVTDEFVECQACEGVGVALRSVERYPVTSMSYNLPAFIVPSAEEVPAVTGAYLIRHDPARALRDLDAARRIIDAYEQTRGRYEAMADARARSLALDKPAPTQEEFRAMDMSDAYGHVVRLLAEAFAGRPGYREEWRP